jgi:hypothetical protein
VTANSSHFREIYRIFRRRLIESEALAPDADYNTRLWQILGAIAVPGLYASGILFGTLLDGDAAPIWTVRGVRTFFAAYSFTIAAFATLFEWDMLFPDRRDFLVLTLFPIKLRDLFTAKIASLGVLLGVLVGTVNTGPVAVMILVLVMVPRAQNLRFIESVLVYIASTSAAAIFGFLCVIAMQALLVNLTSVRLFRRISPYVQMIGMSAMVLALVMCPVYLQVQLIRAFRPEWLWRFPPYWFAALQEPIAQQRDPLFRGIAILGLRALGLVFLLCLGGWAIGFARHYRRTLEAEDSTAGRIRQRSWADVLLSTPQERGIFRFTGAILGRSTIHRMFLACYWSLGIGLGIVAGLTLNIHGFEFSTEAMRSFPFLLTFFIVSGLRTVFQFPAELNANWLFQIAEAGWGRAARRATRLRILASGILPAVILFTPFEVVHWGTAGLFHVALEAIGGLLLAELMFWTFDRVPFTCSYFPGRMNLALLVVFYLYGFTTYSFKMVDIEKWVEQNPAWGSALILVAIIALGLIWRWKTDTEMIRFDGTEPVIQILDLS